MIKEDTCIFTLNLSYNYRVCLFMIVHCLYRPGRQADLSTPYSTEDKNEWSYASTVPVLLRSAVPAVGLYVRRRP
jgi:hypothetical protein